MVHVVKGDPHPTWLAKVMDRIISPFLRIQTQIDEKEWGAQGRLRRERARTVALRSGISLDLHNTRGKKSWSAGGIERQSSHIHSFWICIHLKTQEKRKTSTDKVFPPPIYNNTDNQDRPRGTKQKTLLPVPISSCFPRPQPSKKREFSTFREEEKQRKVLQT